MCPEQVPKPLKWFAHYSMHKFFFKKDQLLNGVKKISHLPAIIVHGRYDVICRVKSAYKLHQSWPASELVIVADAGHSSHEPSVAKALVNATKKMKKLVESVCSDSYYYLAINNYNSY